MNRYGQSNNSSGGIGFVGLLTIVFITLKLCNVIDWSWWWVLSPIWISTGILLAMVAGFLIYTLIIRHKLEKQRQKIVKEMLK